MKKNNIIKSILFTSTILFGISCTKLDEEILDGFNSDANTGGIVNSTALLQSAYEDLRNFQEMGQMFTMDEMSTDALVGPTRGADWDDNAKWRQFHVHTWQDDNEEIINTWNNLLTSVYKCNQIIDNSTDVNQVNQARFLRAFNYYKVIDFFGQTPYREAKSDIELDSKVWTRSEATAFVIKDLEAIISSLPLRIAGQPHVVNIDAAHFLLAKLYLNKAVFTAANPVGPYTFDPTDMNKVVMHVDAISSSLTADYWENFTPTNNNSPELLFVSKNIKGNSGNMQSRWRMSMHYSQYPSGWNGFSSLAEYYNRFDSTDKRRNNASPNILANFGNPIGFQVGQMKNGKNRDAKGRDKDDNGVEYTTLAAGTLNLVDRKGSPLIYTSSVTMITGGATLETAGIRTQKYEPDPSDLEKPENDYILMRYSDALLMKAEAIVRGASGDANAIMTQITTRAGIPTLPATLDNIYLERGRELWYEGWRRNDMIRFGKFLGPRELKPYTSNSKYILYPLPGDALYNPNFKQNPGY
jgi:starch-binding outer membrane protein, SusD/RagB family